MVPLKDSSAAINLAEGLYTKFHKENFKLVSSAQCFRRYKKNGTIKNKYILVK